LQDHGAFPAVSSTRREERRQTALGEVDGWLYTVADAVAKTRTELFFANSLPGAPQTMVMHRDGVEVMTLRVTDVQKP
jgi:hypothetical protein